MVLLAMQAERTRSGSEFGGIVLIGKRESPMNQDRGVFLNQKKKKEEDSLMRIQMGGAEDDDEFIGFLSLKPSPSFPIYPYN